MITRPETQTSAGSSARIAVNPASWCYGHYDFIDGQLAWIGHRNCNCGPQTQRRLDEREARCEGFRERVHKLSDNAARWALMRLIEDIDLGVEEGRIEYALALVEPGGSWEGGL